jgi:two-component system alkaline phosphatase synthesis response regulator PhoP
MNRILLVEDEPGIALALGDDLRIDGYQVDIAEDGLSGLSLARSGDFDLIILDLMLPGKDGLSVCRELRRAGFTTPILMLTAKSQEIEKVIGLEMGADDYVTKPYGTMELRARVKALFRRAGTRDAGAASTYRFGEVEVDFDRGEVRRGGAVVELTAIEFKLLRTFVQSRGHILSRDQLLNGAWGDGISVTERVVDNHIANLRRKIEAEPAAPKFLINVRGLGYRFDG